MLSQIIKVSSKNVGNSLLIVKRMIRKLQLS